MAERENGKTSASNDIGHSSSARADSDDDEHERIHGERALSEDGFRTGSLPLMFQNRSPLRPSFSLLGLRWVNASQLLGFPNSPGLLFEPPTQKTEIVESSCEQQELSKHYSESQRNNRADEETNHFSFVSVAYHPVDAERSCLRARQDGRKFAADDNSSSPPENSYSGIDNPGCSSTSDRSSSPNSFNSRFTSILTMPVPETFRSVWSIEHIPAFHMSSAPQKIKRILRDKEMRRDDNYNIEEITESEVPASRLHSGLRNGNGVHQTHQDVTHDELPQRSVPNNAEYSESVSITRVPSREEYRYGVRYDIDDSRRYRDEVRLVPGQTNPGRFYSSMTTCYANSDYRRYKETLYINLNAPNPKNYTTSVFVFPKSCRETFVSEVDHYDEETIKWYKVGVTMEARDYVSVKFVQVN